MTMSPDAAAPPDEPEGAVVALFGQHEGQARQFYRHLSTTAVTRGLIGPREVPRLWQRHLLNCASVAELLAGGSTTVDVGSGAGLPGLAIAIARPDVSVTLIEPLQRRVNWLDEVIADLGLSNVDVLRARAEEVRGTVRVDAAMARAVAPLPLLAGWCLPLVKPGGRLLAVKGRTAGEELAASVADLTRLGATGWEITTCGNGVLAEPTRVVCVTAGSRASSSRRRAGRGGRAVGT
ncbi:MAG TPA: 16S rRNA (guanine(527)-N(7))-methyltransferase RsmG, partial [Kineosporiaceae bacterium]|nr:16S rRNA (guanine(527)-N(7))-methyltransferase RsmG [Kineosporiaceae bacterium]